MREYHAPFELGHFYHVYNQVIDSEILFREDKNYKFFLKRWNKYLGKYLDVWAYCLIPNHFHFVVRIKSKKESSKIDLTGFENLSGLISQKFSNLFNSYTKSFNKVYRRNGSLFQRPFKRVGVDSENYLQILIHYIHHNPIHHNFTDDYKDWEYSSVLSQKPTKIKREDVLKLFGEKESFISYHNEMKNYNRIKHLIIK